MGYPVWQLICKFYGYVSFIRRSIISCTYANHPVYAELRRYDRRFLLNKDVLCDHSESHLGEFCEWIRVRRSNFVCTSHTNAHIVADFDPVTSHCAQIRRKVRRVIEWFKLKQILNHTEPTRAQFFFYDFSETASIGILQFKDLSISRNNT